MDQRVDVFTHILPPRYNKARWERAEKSHFVEHSPLHLRYVQAGKNPVPSYQVLTELEARFRKNFEKFGHVAVDILEAAPV